MSYPTLSTKAGDVVVRKSRTSPHVYLVSQIGTDGEQFTTDPQSVRGRREADEIARRLLAPSGCAYLTFDDGSWIEIISRARTSPACTTEARNLYN